MQIMAILIHAVNAVLLFTFTDNYLSFQRNYSQQLHNYSSTVMVILFTAHSLRISVVKDSTFESLSLLSSLSLTLLGAILGLKFLTSLTKPSPLKCSSYMSLAVSCLLLTVAAIVHDSTAMTPVIIGIAVITRKFKMSKRSHRVNLYFVTIVVTGCCIIYGSYIYILKNTDKYDIASENTKSTGNREIKESIKRAPDEFFSDFSDFTTDFSSLSSVSRLPDKDETFFQICQAVTNVLKAQLGGCQC